MGHSRIFLILTLAIGALAAPSQFSAGRPPKCSLECAAGASASQFTPKTYVYQYEGTSNVLSRRDKEVEAQLQISADVYLTKVGPCDGVIEVKNPKVQGQQDRISSELLSGRPMMFGMSGHVITRVCADPEDEPVSLNFKKGLLSSIQNSLPDLSPAFSSKTLKEVDILGVCPTTYEITKHTSSEIVVRKFKNHNDCARMEKIYEPSMPLYRSVPGVGFQYSNSTCVQKFEIVRLPTGVPVQQIKQVQCTDQNEAPLYGDVYLATQKSSLTYRSEQSAQVPTISSYRTTNITFEQIPQPKRQEAVQLVEETLSQLCQGIKTTVSKETPREYAKLIEYLQRVPEHEVSRILSNISSGKYCSDTKELESLYLDAVALVSNGGAVKVMVEEIKNGKVSLPRQLLYAISLHVMKKPCIHSIQNLKPLFEMSEVPSPILLGAGSLVKRYCSQTPVCESHQPVKEIMEIISQKVSSCSSTSQKEIRKQLLLLKTVGNMGVMTSEMERNLMQCLEDSSAPTVVRIASSQAFRQAPCKRQPTEQLIQAAIGNKVSQTEVRIASYLAAVRCADRPQMYEILSRISEEPTTQVRSFVLSHMRNLQKTDAPWLQEVKYNLSSVIIPDDYKMDMRLYSQNLDLSYYAPTLGLGAGVDTDIVFSDSYIPKLIKSNITLNILNNVFNLGELGIRVEELEGIVSTIFGREGYLQGTSYEQAIREFVKVVEEIIERIRSELQQGQQPSQMSNILPKILESLRTAGNGKLRMDAFARLFGQEVFFSSFKQNPSLDSESIIQKVIQLFGRLVASWAEMNFRHATGTQFGGSYFTPTSQGIPLETKYIVTLLGKVSGKTEISLPTSQMDAKLSGGIHYNGFVGYSLGAKVGLRANFTGTARQEMKLQASVEPSDVVFKVDLPYGSNAASVNGSIYMVTKLPGRSDKIISPTTKDYPVINFKRCSRALEQIGLEACFGSYLPDVNRSPYPFGVGDFRMNMTLDKAVQNKPLMQMTASIKRHTPKTEIDLKFHTSSRHQPLFAEFYIERMANPKSQSILVSLMRHGMTRTVKVLIGHESVQQGREIEMSVFYSKQRQVSQSDMIADCKLAGGRSANSYKGLFELKTMNQLEPYFKSNIELEGELYMRDMEEMIPEKLKIKKCEVLMVLAEEYKTENYIRPTYSNVETKYSFASITSRLPQEKLLSVRGDLDIKGRIREYFESSLKMFGETKNNKYESLMVLKNQKKEKMALFMAKKNSEMANTFEVSVSEKQPEVYETKMKVEIPRSKINYEINGPIKAQPSHYEINMELSKDQQPIYQMEGSCSPVRLSSGFKQSSELFLKSLKTQKEFSMKSSLLMSPEKNATSLAIKSNKGLIFKTETISKIQSQGRHIEIELEVPKVVESQTTLEIMLPQKITLDKKLVLFPDTSRTKTYKLNSMLDLIQQRMEVRSRLAGNKLDVIVDKYEILCEEASAQFRGEVIVNRGTYKYQAAIAVPQLKRRYDLPMELSIQVGTPEGRSFSLAQKYEKQSTGSLVTYKEHLEILTLAANTYTLSASAKRNYDSPLSLETSVEWKSPRRVADFEMRLKKESTENIVYVSFHSNGPKGKYESEIDYTSSPSERKATAEVSKNDKQIVKGFFEQRGRELELQLTITPLDKPEYQLEAKKSSPSKVTIVMHKNGEEILECKCHCNGGNCVADIKFPTRKSEIQSQIQFEQTSIEVAGKIKSQGRRERSIVVNLRSPQPQSKSSAVLDIFEDQSNKIEVQLDIQTLQENSYLADMQLTLPNSSPRLVVEGAWTNRTQKADMKVYSSKQSTHPDANMMLSHVKSSPISGAIYAILRTPERKFEFAGELQRQKISRCLGASLNGTFVCDKHGSYDIATAVCAPGYVEVGAKKSSSESMYFAKLGMQTPSEMKMEVCEVFKNARSAFSKAQNPLSIQSTYSLYGTGAWKPKRSILYLGSKLRSSWLMSLGAHAEVEPLRKFVAHMTPSQEKLDKVSKMILVHYPNEILKRGPHSAKLPQELEEWLEMARSSLSHLHERIAEYKVARKWETAKNMVEETFEHTMEIVEVVKTKLDQVLQGSFKVSLKELTHSLQGAEEMLRHKMLKLKDEVKRIIHNPSVLREYKHLGVIIKRIESSSFFKWLEQAFEKIANGIAKEFKDAIHFVKKIYQVIYNDVKSVVQKMEELPIIKRLIQWIEKWFHPSGERVYLYREIMRKISMVHLSRKEVGVSFNIPLRRPVSSLRTAIPSIGLPLKWVRLPYSQRNGYNVLPLIKPHSKIARVSGNQVITYDGLVIPFIMSKCPILLSESQNVKVSFERPNSRWSKVTLETPHGQEISIEMEKGKWVKVPSMQNQQELQIGSVTVRKPSDRRVEIQTKPYYITITDAMVEVHAEPNAFRQTRGLMGTHDSEIASDYPQNSMVSYKPDHRHGPHHLESVSARKLFKQYNEDRSCRIPQV